jgi:hypothetical protein
MAEPEETVSNPFYPRAKWVPVNVVERPLPRNKRFKKKTAKILSIIKAKKYQDEERMMELMQSQAREEMEKNLEDLEDISEERLKESCSHRENFNLNVPFSVTGMRTMKRKTISQPCPALNRLTFLSRKLYLKLIFQKSI